MRVKKCCCDAPPLWAGSHESDACGSPTSCGTAGTRVVRVLSLVRGIPSADFARNPAKPEPEWQNDEAQNHGGGSQGHRPPDLMILCFIILPNPLRRNSARPAMKQIVSSRVGRRGEAPLVPPYRLHRPNKAMALQQRFDSRRNPVSNPALRGETPADLARSERTCLYLTRHKVRGFRAGGRQPRSDVSSLTARDITA